MMHQLELLNIDPLSNLIDLIKNTLTKNPLSLSKSLFMCELTTETKEHNSNILAKFNFNLTRLITAYPNTEVLHRSEFRDTSILEPIL